jgi:hypothetical protein
LRRVAYGVPFGVCGADPFAGACGEAPLLALTAGPAESCGEAPLLALTADPAATTGAVSTCVDPAGAWIEIVAGMTPLTPAFWTFPIVCLSFLVWRPFAVARTLVTGDLPDFFFGSRP